MNIIFIIRRDIIMDVKATVNILGTCISRDTFSMHPDDGGYKVQKYVNECDPFYFVCKGMDIDKEKYDAFDVSKFKFSNFRKRCMYLDATKTVMDYIKEADSDFLVIDTALFRISSMRWGDTTVCVSNNRAPFFEALRKAGIIKEKLEEKLKVPEEDFDEMLEDFAQEVLKVYKPEQIILIEVRGVFVNTDGEKTEAFGNLDNIYSKNIRVNAAFEVMKKKLAGCHIIPALDALLADKNHWLGRAPMHYTKELYDYQYECINVINEKLPREEEEKRIEELRRRYTNIYYEKYYNKISEGYALDIAERNRELMDEAKKQERLEKQADLLLKAALHARSGKAEKVDTGIKTAVVYGWTKVSEFILKLLAENEIKPVAVMETTNRKTVGEEYISGGVPVLRRGTAIPKADCVIVADMISTDRIIEKLKKMPGIKYYTAEEFAGMVKAV